MLLNSRLRSWFYAPSPLLILLLSIIILTNHNVTPFVYASSTAPQHCTIEQFSFGSWIHNNASTPNDPPGTESRCGLKTVYKQNLLLRWGEHKKGNWSNYCWKPHNCYLYKFSIQHMCKVVEGKHILIIGDSTSFMFYQALFMQMEIPGQPQAQANNTRFAFDVMCDGQSSVRFIRNDQIIVTDPPPGCDCCLDWKQYIADYDIIVINKGVHIIEVREDDLFLKVTEQSAVDLATYMKNTSLLIYRTAVQPHPYCTMDAQADLKPVLSHADFKPILYDIDSRFNAYDWYKIHSRDKKTREIYKQHLPNMHVLDVSLMTDLRPDGHRADGGDCLHYYLPGVVDQWFYLFYNFLIKYFGHHFDHDFSRSNEIIDTEAR